jgi:hypothetical protein
MDAPVGVIKGGGLGERCFMLQSEQEFSQSGRGPCAGEGRSRKRRGCRKRQHGVPIRSPLCPLEPAMSNFWREPDSEKDHVRAQ